VRHTPRVTAAELKAMQDAGENLAILDGRTFAEFQRMSIPGGVSCPNGELAVRVAGLAPDPETKIVVNCAGRTRSIVGAQTLIDLGIPNPVYALENGTQGWFLAGLQLEHGANRHYRLAPSLSATDLAALQARVRALAEMRGVQFVGAAEVAAWIADPARTTYLLDVRTPEENEGRPVPGFVQAPGGQLVQATDQWIGTRGARIVLVDAEEVRAPVTAQWLRQLGHEAYVLAGGLAAAAPLAGLRSVAAPHPAARSRSHRPSWPRVSATAASASSICARA
jgi:rhodanese-related sulfurtransferase